VALSNAGFNQVIEADFIVWEEAEECGGEGLRLASLYATIRYACKGDTPPKLDSTATKTLEN
jgi:hypothetical protein